jgi:hypothetical protein
VPSLKAVGGSGGIEALGFLATYGDATISARLLREIKLLFVRH